MDRHRRVPWNRTALPRGLRFRLKNSLLPGEPVATSVRQVGARLFTESFERVFRQTFEGLPSEPLLLEDGTQEYRVAIGQSSLTAAAAGNNPQGWLTAELGSYKRGGTVLHHTPDSHPMSGSASPGRANNSPFGGRRPTLGQTRCLRGSGAPPGCRSLAPRLPEDSRGRVPKRHRSVEDNTNPTYPDRPLPRPLSQTSRPSAG